MANRTNRPKRKLLQQEKALIERYMRLAVYKKTSQLANALARRFVRIKLQLSERKMQRVLASTLETVAFEAARARRHEFNASASVLNLGLFFLLAERDVQAAKIDALTHPDPWRRSLAARVILLTIHELDLDKVAGNKLRQALQDGNVPEDVISTVTEAMRTIRKAQSKAQRQFTYLRNATIAHRDADAIRQYRDIVGLDGLEVMQIAAEFYKGTHLFVETLPLLTSHLGTWPALLAQLAAKPRRNKQNGELTN